jgi:superfamily I DNA/RNA helicase
MYTIHSYKGLEDDNIRIANDIEDEAGEDENLYYVALTRGMKFIVEDKKVSASLSTVQREQLSVLDYFKGKTKTPLTPSSHGLFSGVRR